MREARDVGPLTHLDDEGRVEMVDVGDKPDTERIAVARGEVTMRPETLRLIALLFEPVLSVGDRKLPKTLAELLMRGFVQMVEDAKL